VFPDRPDRRDPDRLTIRSGDDLHVPTTVLVFFRTPQRSAPLGPAATEWVARESRCLDQAASASGPSGSSVMACPLMLTLRAFSQCSRTVVSCSRA
jgi:hypothetical protein